MKATKADNTIHKPETLSGTKDTTGFNKRRTKCGEIVTPDKINCRWGNVTCPKCHEERK